MVDPTPGPLAGIRVLELGSFIAGPFAGQLLGDYGADVIKVEAPAGDPMRRMLAVAGGASEDLPSPPIDLDNRGKRSIVLQLPEESEVMERLLATADVFLTNLRPDAVSRLGLDPEEVLNARGAQLRRVRLEPGLQDFLGHVYRQQAI